MIAAGYFLLRLRRYRRHRRDAGGGGGAVDEARPTAPTYPLADGFREPGVFAEFEAAISPAVDYDGSSDCGCADAGETCNYPAITRYWTQMFGLRRSVYPLVIDGESHATPSGTVDLVYGPATAIDMRFSNDGIELVGVANLRITRWCGRSPLATACAPSSARCAPPPFVYRAWDLAHGRRRAGAVRRRFRLRRTGAWSPVAP